jgi:hypothetical protein
MRAGKRIVHSRFCDGKPVRKSEPYNRIVTSCWSYDNETKVLTYGATVYSRTDKSVWNKTAHRLKATERYEKNPCKIVLLAKLSPKAIAIDWHIASEYIFKFGCEGKTGLVYLYDFYNEKFSYLKPNKLFYTLDQLAKEYNFSIDEFRVKIKEAFDEDVNNRLEQKVEKRKSKQSKANHWLCLLSNIAVFGLCYLYL